MESVAFIICTNDEKQVAEANYYIDRLIVPRDCRIEKAYIRDAPSMASGYNQGMRQTRAKYKVYLHHDVYIRNRNLIADIIGIFEGHPEVGLLGVCGATEHIVSGNYLDALNYGFVAPNRFPSNYIGCECEKDYREVKALDGVFIATQYDISWREDLFDGWDYYDISACMEFQRRGYYCGVVNQKEQDPWVYHDSEGINIGNYYNYREVFVKEYADIYSYAPDTNMKSEQQNIERKKTIGDFCTLIESLIETNRLTDAVELMWEYRKTVSGDKRLGALKKILFIAKKEIDEVGKPLFISQRDGVDQSIANLSQIRYALLHVEISGDTAAVGEILKNKRISDIAISWACVFYITDMERFVHNIAAEFFARGEQVRFTGLQDRIRKNCEWIFADDPTGRY